MLNLTNKLLTREDLTLATYKELISGWGYIPFPQQDVWLNTTVSYLYEVLNNKTTDDSSEFDDLIKQFPDYVFNICTNNSYACWSKLNQGENFYSFITKLKIQGKTLDTENLFQSGSSVSVELTSGSNYCPSITP